MHFLLVNRFFGENQTPTGRIAWDLAGELRRQGHRVTVFATRGVYVATVGADVSAGAGVEVRHLWTLGRGRLLNWVAFWLQAVVAMIFCRWERCVLLTDPPFLPFGVWLTKWLHGRRRFYWWTMDLYPEALVAAGMLREGGWRHRGLRQLNELGLAAMSGVVALGARQAARLEKYQGWQRVPGFSIVVPPWDSRVLSVVARETNSVLARFGWQQRKVALYAGNLGEGHSFQELVAAAALLAGQGREDWLFLFVVRGAGVAVMKKLSSSLPNVVVLDYLPEGERAALLWAATVHLITMKPGWEGVIVPSKISGVLQTAAQMLFIGPADADTAVEIRQLGRGRVLAAGATAAEIVAMLDELAGLPALPVLAAGGDGVRRVAEFVAA